MTADFALQSLQLLVVVSGFGEFYFYGHVVVFFIGGQRDEVVVAQLLEVHQDLLYLNREDVNASQHHHIVRTATHAIEADVVSATRTGTAQHAREVTGTIAQQGHSFATQGGQHQLANLAVGHGFQCLGVHNLYNIIIFPEMQAVLFGTFEAHARTAHLAHSKAVVGLHTHHFLNAPALFLGVRFCADSQHLEFRVFARIYSLFLHHLVQAGDVTGNCMYGGSTEVLDELYLPQGVTCCGRHGEHPQFLGSILESQTASEHSVAGGILEDIIGTQAYHPQISGHLVCPLVQVLLGMENDGGVTRSAGRGMQTHAVAKWHASHPERIGRAQVVLRSERQFPYVVQRLDILGGDACLSKLLAVEFIVHAVAHSLLEAFQLQSLNFCTRQRFSFRVEEKTHPIPSREGGVRLAHCFVFVHILSVFYPTRRSPLPHGRGRGWVYSLRLSITCALLP